MIRLNCYLMCLALLTSLAGCYASAGPGYPRHARREREVVVVHHDDHHDHHDHDHDHDHWH